MKELARIAGKSESWVHRIETGQIEEEPGFSVIVKWAAVLGVSPLELSGVAVEGLPPPAYDAEKERLAELGEGVIALVRESLARGSDSSRVVAERAREELREELREALPPEMFARVEAVMGETQAAFERMAADGAREDGTGGSS